jgi:hypothetical protein
MGLTVRPQGPDCPQYNFKHHPEPRTVLFELKQETGKLSAPPVADGSLVHFQLNRSLVKRSYLLTPSTKLGDLGLYEKLI